MRGPSCLLLGLTLCLLGTYPLPPLILLGSLLGLALDVTVLRPLPPQVLTKAKFVVDDPFDNGKFAADVSFPGGGSTFTRGFVSSLLQVPLSASSESIVLDSQWRSPRRKAPHPLSELFASKRAVSSLHSRVSRPAPFEDSRDIDTSKLEEHITLAASKNRRRKIASRKRILPRKYELVDTDLDSALEEVPQEVCSFSIQCGFGGGP
ncbi:hypothetical protein CJ030_MR0G008572 [Morella rubra]|uniref:Uncharacterized protein n=1 Tax=Morella rubra TaxID=262757 RepID=A0A6A1UHM5_9ROSI|nr:hypothetical protein CJ030_MR0G008572 [Morella rubra]